MIVQYSGTAPGRNIIGRRNISFFSLTESFGYIRCNFLLWTLSDVLLAIYSYRCRTITPSAVGDVSEGSLHHVIHNSFIFASLVPIECTTIILYIWCIYRHSCVTRVHWVRWRPKGQISESRQDASWFGFPGCGTRYRMGVELALISVPLHCMMRTVSQARTLGGREEMVLTERGNKYIKLRV